MHNQFYQRLFQKIQNNQAVIGIIGLGYVGLPLALSFSRANYKVIGFDIDKNKIKSLNNGMSFIKHIKSADIKNAKKQGLKATSDFSQIQDVDAIVICVPTPLTKTKDPNLTFVTNTMSSISPYLKRGQIISLESTTYPGTTEELIAPLINSKKFIIGKDFYLVYSPEREDPGNKQYNTETIPKIIGGISKNCLEIGTYLYSRAINQMIPVSSTRTAEMVKLLENIHRAVNIGLVNEMKIVSDKMGIDIHEVIKAASTKPFGFTPFFPGPGLGGHCIPIDPFYLTWKAKEYDISTRFIELAGEVNTNMPNWVCEKVTSALNSKGKSVKNSKILILGISYKKNVDDMRESPAVILMKLLQDKGAKINYSDPHVPSFPPMRNFHYDLKSVTITPKALVKFDLILIATDHDDFDYSKIKKYGKLIVDTRGIYKHSSSRIIKA